MRRHATWYQECGMTYEQCVAEALLGSAGCSWT